MVDIVHRNNSWPSSKAFDYAELKTAKQGDPLEIRGITQQHSALSGTRHNGSYAARGITDGSL